MICNYRLTKVFALGYPDFGVLYSGVFGIQTAQSVYALKGIFCKRRINEKVIHSIYGITCDDFIRL